MLGVDIMMSVRKKDIEDKLFKPLSEQEILSELEESRACYENGEYMDFDDALEIISKKYGL